LPFATILILAQFIRLTLMPYAAIGFAAGQQQRMLISPLGEGVVNLGCSIVGAHFLGAMGVALGTLVGACIGVLLHFVNSMPKTDSMLFRRRQLLVTGIVKPIACCLPSSLLVLILVRWISTVTGELVLVSVAELVGALIIWNANFDKLERGEVISMVARMLGSRLRLTQIGA
jgi:peptidoglycan biosynthesis protein MviN/MurJ (putative lipid II flippase)